MVGSVSVWCGFGGVVPRHESSVGAKRVPQNSPKEMSILSSTPEMLKLKGGNGEL